MLILKKSVRRSVCEKFKDKLVFGVAGFEEGFLATFFADVRVVIVDDFVLVGGLDRFDGVLGPR